jgi:hypothetical protein
LGKRGVNWLRGADPLVCASATDALRSKNQVRNRAKERQISEEDLFDLAE